MHHEFTCIASSTFGMFGSMIVLPDNKMRWSNTHHTTTIMSHCSVIIKSFYRPVELYLLVCPPIVSSACVCVCVCYCCINSEIPSDILVLVNWMCCRNCVLSAYCINRFIRLARLLFILFACAKSKIRPVSMNFQMLGFIHIQRFNHWNERLISNQSHVFNSDQKLFNSIFWTLRILLFC